MKHLKLIYSTAICVLTLAFAACNDISEDERFIYVKPADVNRAILLEDFTGQLCPNCPTAAAEIESLISDYGDSVIIAVGIHSGPTGFEGFGDNIGLLTETGDEYFYHWGITTQPAGIINRSSGILQWSEWATSVRNEISKQATLSMEISNAYDESSRTLDISVSSLGTNGTTSGKLQVWLVEDGITAFQTMLDGSENMNYVHNHVFRAAVNGTWGDDFNLDEGESVTNTFTYDIPTDWNPENVSVVAFVYNDSGVQQVVKAAIMNDNEEE
ncbi:Omp28 family outer membrane lipoprotein [Marseilla massiliensis]|jgi:hypothetical protein|uniref:Omp28 family outer membrane lipoprotein n=1 Tax=Marseilla massiliensis TaxID=1841864 RepID=A0A938WRJ1_9BACT|nr:Omp28 family outer membrane lipoprotein [Marseilla massiliensis]MBM6672800.1 Omp28 family outer membrane lipoprotein [Marseilla massiliensis]